MRADEEVQQHDVYNGATVVDMASDFRSTNLALYGEVEWRMTSKTVLTAGARGEHRGADYTDSNGAAFSPDATMAGGSLSLRYELSQTQRAYLTLARGYKAGGFNIGSFVPTDKRDFDSEILHSVELGFKAENADRTVGGDIALFYMRRNDQQVQTGEQLIQDNPGSFVLYTDNA